MLARSRLVAIAKTVDPMSATTRTIIWPQLVLERSSLLLSLIGAALTFVVALGDWEGNWHAERVFNLYLGGYEPYNWLNSTPWYAFVSAAFSLAWGWHQLRGRRLPAWMDMALVASISYTALRLAFWLPSFAPGAGIDSSQLLIPSVALMCLVLSFAGKAVSAWSGRWSYVSPALLALSAFLSFNWGQGYEGSPESRWVVPATQYCAAAAVAGAYWIACLEKSAQWQDSPEVSRERGQLVKAITADGIALGSVLLAGLVGWPFVAFFGLALSFNSSPLLNFYLVSIWLFVAFALFRLARLVKNGIRLLAFGKSITASSPPAPEAALHVIAPVSNAEARRVD